MDLIEIKQQARALATRKRRAVAEADEGRAIANVTDLMLEATAPQGGTVASGYLPIGSELDIRPLMARLRARGLIISLPCAVERFRPLIFREWSPGDPLVSEPWGTQAPADDALRLTPELLLVPLLAFDREGYRLGYGGGFYDRTLARLRARTEVTAVGVAYAAQEMASVPHDDTDERLDLIVTEREVIRPANG